MCALCRVKSRCRSLLDIVKECHEAKIHVQLLMAMKERQPGIVRREINIDLLIAADHHDIFHHPESLLPVYLSQFETVAMKVNRVNIVSRILHAQAVAFVFFHAQHGLHVLFREGDVIDRPQIETILCRILLGKSHVEDLVRF